MPLQLTALPCRTLATPGTRAQIDSEELYEYLRFLGHRCKKSEVEDIIWEVDEDSDGCISWEEFKAMCAVPLPPKARSARRLRSSACSAGGRL